MALKGSRIVVVVLVALIGSLAWGGYQLLRGFGQGHFPEIPPGLYTGSLECQSGSCSMPILIEKQAQLRQLAVFVGDERVPAQRAVTQDPSGATKLPLIITAPDLRLKLVGEAKGIERYHGTFVDPINSTQGTWTLEKISDERLDPVQETGLRNWYAAWMSLQANEGKIEELRQEYQHQTRKIEKINSSLLDDDALRRKADERLGSAASALESMRDELSKVRQELEGALRNVELAQRVSSRGNLVLMSRESIQREARWIEISLNLFAPETAPGFEDSLERAYRVQQLKDDIAQERDKLYREDTSRRYGGESPETRTEEEFYHEAR